MKVSFRREVLITTKQYENQRICVELADVEVKQGESVSAVYEATKKWVDNQIADEVTNIRLGVDNVKIASAEKRRRDMRAAVIRERGLSCDVDDGIGVDLFHGSGIR